MNREDLLHERIGQIEAGVPLEACLADLPEDEASLLRLVAALRAVPYPDETADTIAAQRARLRRMATGNQTKGSLIFERITEAIRRFPTPWNSLAALPRSTALLVACAVVIAVIGGALLLRPPSPQGTDIAKSPGAAPSPLIEPTLPPFSVYLPAVSNPLVAPNSQSAVVSHARGIVEVQTKDGVWTAAKVGQVVAAGERLRTGNLSSAALLFYDGSQARLGPATEVSVDELDAQAANGRRVVLLTQWIGETDHDVAPSSDAASRYEVRTPSGTGAAKGTSFHVSVSASLITRISVEEGSVAATSLNVTVIVIAGQVTTIHVGAPPDRPAFRVSGEGVVTQIGETWRIGGLDFLTDDDTVIVGNPQVGDFVSVEGHLLADGTRVADLIALLHRAQENTFSFTGTVDSIGETEWVVSGRAISVTAETEIDAGIEVGDDVHVEGVILAGGTLQAQRIRLVDEAGLPFAFTGVVESIADDTWTISGIVITVDENTEITGDPDVGDIVKVEGRILEGNIWLAKSIRLAEEDERRFEFTGTVDNIDPWVVSGVHFDISAQTVIDAGIDIGDRVRVEGRVLDDGTWLAERIELLDEDQASRFEFIGEVSSIDPWIIGGLDITVDDETEIDDDIEIGDTVRVSGIILPDGALLARRIERLDDDLGCLDIVTVIVRIDGNRIVLGNGQTIDLTDQIEVSGNLGANSVVIIHICISEDGTITVISIIIIFQLEPPAPPRPPRDEDDDDRDGKVILCHLPPGNASAAHTITVDAPAVASHLAHGDHLGPCNGGGGDHDEDDERDD